MIKRAHLDRISGRRKSFLQKLHQNCCLFGSFGSRSESSGTEITSPSNSFSFPFGSIVVAFTSKLFSYFSNLLARIRSAIDHRSVPETELPAGDILLLDSPEVAADEEATECGDRRSCDDEAAGAGRRVALSGDGTSGEVAPETAGAPAAAACAAYSEDQICKDVD